MHLRWIDPRFWRWWWRNRAAAGTKVAIWLAALSCVVVAGWITANRVTGDTAASSSGDATALVRTVHRTVTVQQGRTVIRKLVPVVRTIVVRPRARVLTKTILLTRSVSVPGRGRTTVETVPTTKTVRVLRTVTTIKTVPVERTLTIELVRTVTVTVSSSP